MIIEKETTRTEIVIDLTGPDGNVFNLIGRGSQFCKQIGLDAKEFRTKMMSSDYEHAVQTFDDYFGHFVTLLK
jgi:hypothetical protein